MAKVQLTSAKRPVKKVVKPPLRQAESVKKSPVTQKSTLTGLSLRQLLKATPPYIKSNAGDTVIKSLKQAITKGGLPGIRAKTQTPGSRVPGAYDTTIVGKERDLPVSRQKHVLVSCSCGWFWSHCEYALNHWGSAIIKYSNGEPAVVTNPQNHPLLCKHLVALAETVLEERM